MSMQIQFLVGNSSYVLCRNYFVLSLVFYVVDLLLTRFCCCKLLFKQGKKLKRTVELCTADMWRVHRFSGQHDDDNQWGGGTRLSSARNTSRLSSLRSASRGPNELHRASPGVPSQSSDEALKNITLPPLVPRPPSTHSRPGSRETGLRWGSSSDLRWIASSVFRFFRNSCLCYCKRSWRRENCTRKKFVMGNLDCC